MKFRVTFKCKEAYNTPINIPNLNRIGFKHIHILRTLMQECVPLEDIYNHRAGYTNNVTISVSERMAQESGHFNDTSDIEVFVPEQSLNDLTKYETEVQEYIHRQNSREVLLKIIPDEEKIITEWKAEGYPLKWDKDTNNKSEHQRDA